MTARGEFDAMSKKKLPMIPSHEPSGIVVRLGERAEELSRDNAGFAEGVVKLGDRVGSTPFGNFCGECDDCREGGERLRYCDNLDYFGVTADGAFAEYCAIDVRSSVRLPSSMSFDVAAPLMCAGASIWGPLVKCKLQEGQCVAIVGAGALGHLGCQMAKCLGLRSIVVDTREAPLEMCRSLPYLPDVLFNSASVDHSSAISVKEAIEACGGHADAVIVATDALPAFQFAFELVKKHGLVVVVGQPSAPIPVPFDKLVFKDITIQGSCGASSAQVKRMVDLVAAKKIECKTRPYQLTRVHDLIVGGVKREGGPSFSVKLADQRSLPLSPLSLSQQADYGKPDHAGKLVVRVHDG